MLAYNIYDDYLHKHNQFKFYFACNVTIDKFTNEPMPQIVIKDIMIIN